MKSSLQEEYVSKHLKELPVSSAFRDNMEPTAGCSSSMASSDNFESKVAEIVSFTKQIFSGEEGLKKTKLLETLKDIVAEQEDKSKPKCKKRRISEVISELEDNESVKIQKKGRHYIIMPKKNTVEKHDVDLLDVSLISSLIFSPLISMVVTYILCLF